MLLVQKDNKPNKKITVSQVLKPVLACLALFLIYRAVDLQTLIDIFKKIQLPYFVIFMLISYPMIWTSAMKWALFVPNKASCPSIGKMMKMYTVSYFANLFLPSSIGGDAIRSLSLGRHLSDNAAALLATFYEKYTGLITLVFVSLLGSIFGNFSTSEITLINLLVFIVVVMTFIVIAKGYCSEQLKKIFVRLPIPQKIKSFFVNLLSRRLDHILSFQFLSKVFFWSLLFYFFTVLNTYIGLLVVGIDTVSIFDLMCVVPIILFVSMLPLTPGGIGVQEGAFMYFLAKIGVPSADGLALAILLRVKSFILAGLGWYFYAKGPVRNVDCPSP